MHSIRSEFIDSTTFSDIDDIKLLPNHKRVINILKCDKISSVLDFLISNHENIPENVFVYIFHITNPEKWTFCRQKLKELSECLKNCQMDIIFVFQAKFRHTKFLCKNKTQIPLAKIELSRRCEEYEFLNNLGCDEFLFKLIVTSGIECSICGIYEPTFSTITVNTERNFMGLKLIDYALINFDSLTFKFLLLFGIDLNAKNENGDRLLETAVKCGNFEGFLTLLEMDFGNLLDIHESSRYNLLMLAVEKGNNNIVNYLLDLNIFDVNFEVNGKTALKLATENEKIDNILVLLMNDAMYDEKFINKIYENDGMSEVKDFLETTKKFHEIVKFTDKQQEIVAILKKYPKTRHFFNANGQSVLAKALNNLCSNENGNDEKNVKFIEFLMENGLRMDLNEEIPNTFGSSSQTSSIWSSYFHKILTMCITRKSYSKNLVEAVKLLHEIPETRILLQTFATYDDFRIILDRNEESIGAIEKFDQNIVVEPAFKRLKISENEEFSTLSYKDTLTFENIGATSSQEKIVENFSAFNENFYKLQKTFSIFDVIAKNSKLLNSEYQKFLFIDSTSVDGLAKVNKPENDFRFPFRFHLQSDDSSSEISFSTQSTIKSSDFLSSASMTSFDIIGSDVESIKSASSFEHIENSSNFDSMDEDFLDDFDKISLGSQMSIDNLNEMQNSRLSKANLELLAKSQEKNTDSDPKSQELLNSAQTPLGLSFKLASSILKLLNILIFKNNFMPFEKRDNLSRNKLNKILKKIKRKKNSGESLIESVFEVIDQENRKLALITSVPKMRLFHAKDVKIFEDLREKFPDLFEFYENLMKYFENHIQLKKINKNVEKLNKISGIESEFAKFAEIIKWTNQENFLKLNLFNETKEENFDLDFEFVDSKTSIKSFKYFLTNSPFLTMLQIWRERGDNLVIFANFECFENENFLNEIGKYLKSSYLVISVNQNDRINPKIRNLIMFDEFSNKILYLVKSNINLEDALSKDVTSDEQMLKFAENFNENYEKSQESFALKILSETCGSIEKLENILENLKRMEELMNMIETSVNNPKSQDIEAISQDETTFQSKFQHLIEIWSSFPKIIHNYFDFSSKTKKYILNSQVDFQGTSIKLFEILDDKIYAILKNLPIDDIINPSKTFKIGQKLVKVDKFYYNRRFVDSFVAREGKDLQKFTNISDPITNFEDLVRQKIILLCDEPGMGKSTTLKQLQFEFKHYFPSYFVIYVDLKLHNKTYEQFKDIQHWNHELFTKFFKKLQNLSKFDSIFFHQCLISQKVVFLIDGVDELTKNNKEFIINFTKDLYRITQCRLWIGMRPYCVSEYRGAFSIFAYHLEAINQQKFMESFIKSKNMSEQEAKNTKRCLKSFMNFNTCCENPLGIRILLDVYNFLDVEVGIYGVYEAYVAKKFAKFDSSDTKLQEILIRHQQIAMKKLITTMPTRDEFEDLDILDNPLNDDDIVELSIFDIIYGTSTDQIIFIHQTFYEFFIANFLVQKVFEGPECSLDDDQVEKVHSLFVYAIVEANLQVVGQFIDAYIKDNESKILKRENRNLIGIFRNNKLVEQKTIYRTFRNIFEINLSYILSSKFLNIAKIILKIFANEPEMDNIFLKFKKNCTEIYNIFFNWSCPNENLINFLNIFAASLSENRVKLFFSYVLNYGRPKIIILNILQKMPENDMDEFLWILNQVFNENELKILINWPYIENEIDSEVLSSIREPSCILAKFNLVDNYNYSDNFLKSLSNTSEINLIKFLCKNLNIYEQMIKNFNKFMKIFENLMNFSLKVSFFDDFLYGQNLYSNSLRKITSYIDRAELREILIYENFRISAKILERVNINKDSSDIEFLIQLITDNLKSDDALEVINSSSEIKSKFYYACAEELDINVSCFWNFLEIFLPHYKIKEFLCHLDPNSKFLTLHYSFLNPNIESYKYFEKNELKKLLKIQDESNETIFFRVYKSKKSLCHNFWDKVFEIFETEELKVIFSHRNVNNRTMFYVSKDFVENLSAYDVQPQIVRDFVRKNFDLCSELLNANSSAGKRKRNVGNFVLTRSEPIDIPLKK